MTAAIRSPVPRPAEVTWYYAHGDARIGPIAESALLQALRQGLIHADTLVWQNAFERWKPAASIPMLAVNLKERHASLLRESEANGSPQQTTLSATVYEDLTEAVTDEEAAEPEIDAQQLREILVRTSRPPPERSIPPASVTSNASPNHGMARRAFGATKWFGFAGSLLVLSTVVALLVLREPRHDVASTVAGNAAIAETVAHPQVTPTRDPPKGDIRAPHTEPRLDPAQAIAQRVKGADATVPTHPLIQGGRSAATIHDAGTLDVQLLVQKLQHGLPMYADQCWDKLRAPAGEVAKDPSLRIELTIDRLGNVYDIVSSKAPPGYRGVGLCIIGRMRGWKFPRAETGTRAVVTVTRLTSK